MALSHSFEFSCHWTGNVHDNKYIYIDDLVQMGNLVAQGPPPTGILAPNCSPLFQKLDHWAELLQPHPDKRFCDFILKGIKEGFHIGFDRLLPLTSAKHNLPSTRDHPEVVDHYITGELEKKRLIRPVSSSALVSCGYIHCSPFGVISKKGSDAWRLIVDLSSPAGSSINNGIREDWASLHYVSVDQAAQKALDLGQNALMAKCDIKSAFRIIPVHPEDKPLLGMQWRDSTYMDSVLPFSLRSAPKLFNAVADALQFIMIKGILSSYMIVRAHSVKSTRVTEFYAMKIIFRKLKWRLIFKKIYS